MVIVMSYFKLNISKCYNGDLQQQSKGETICSGIQR